MPELADEVFSLARSVASGARSRGESAGHSQVQLWRDWQQVDDSQLERLRAEAPPDGVPLATRRVEPSTLRFEALAVERGPVADQVALVMPTSLCSGQVARLIVEGLNARLPSDAPVRRYVALVHTEGCGSTNNNDLFLQTLLGHLQHPFVHRALLLEHGCEQTHNDAVRHYMAQHGAKADDYGWASIQLDGGLERVGEKVSAWFEHSMGAESRPPVLSAGAESLSIALVATGELPDHAAEILAALAGGVIAAGGSVVAPSSGPIAESMAFRARLLVPDEEWRATLAYGQPFGRPGLHVMDAPTVHPTEVVSGLGGTGVQVMIGHVDGFPLHTHPMIPLLQVSGIAGAHERFGSDLDVELDGNAAQVALATLEQRIAEVASRTSAPGLAEAGGTDFQLTRGRLGISV
jgi:altronate dehydratase